MKCFMLFTGSGPIVILTSYPSVTDAALLGKLRAKGIDKFIAFEIPVELARKRYETHFAVVLNDLHETDDLRVLDYNGQRAFRLFGFKELSAPLEYESEPGPGATA